MTKLTLSLLSFPPLAIAAEKPSMASMWLELVFMLVMLVILKITDFSNQQKFVLFATYISIDILTQALWFAILVFIGLYVVFKKSSD